MNALLRFVSLKRKSAFGPSTLLLAATVFVLVLSDAGYLLKRHLWMDEVHSWLLLTSESDQYALRALADGADFNPPGWFLVTRWISLAAGRTELVFRLMSLAWMSLAAAGVYRILRTRVDHFAAILATLITLTHPLIVFQSTEIRFYGFWCAAQIWLCVALDWQTAKGATCILRRTLIIALTMVITTTHYFGVILVNLAALPGLLTLTPRLPRFRDSVAIVLTSIVSVVACLPFLSGQRAALSRPTWISPPTLNDSLGYLGALTPYWAFLIVLPVTLAVTQIIRPWYAPGARRIPGVEVVPATEQPRTDFVPWAFVSTGMMPVAIIAVSWLLQPALVTRYAMVGLFAWSIPIAMIISRLRFPGRAVISAAMLISLTTVIQSTVRTSRTEDSGRLMEAARITNHQCRLIVYEDRIVWMPLIHVRPELSARCCFADFEDDELIPDSALRTVQRDAGRRISKWFPQYRIRPIGSLGHESEFLVRSYDGADVSSLRFPFGFTSESLGESLYRFRSRTAEESEHVPVSTSRLMTGNP